MAASQATPDQYTFLKLDGISKSYGEVPAVRQLSLDIDRGESVTLLGPSGCGKTTTLRMIAGFEKPDSGEIVLNGEPLVSVARGIHRPPERRRMGMVFQSYAIWPHMTVAANVGFPLKVRGVAATEIGTRVAKALDMVGLAGFGDRPAPRLSGGQQQRVALARALVYEPDILLLDEPLSNLDAKLREQMQVELKLLKERLSLSLVYVTHDQDEALGLSDRIVLMNHGRIEQIGSPRDLYLHPRTKFARDFLGKSVTMRGRVRDMESGHVCVTLDFGGHDLLRCPRLPGNDFTIGDAVEISLRPQSIQVLDADADAATDIASITGIVEALLYQGERSECEVRLGEDKILVYVPPDLALTRGQEIKLGITSEALSVWPR